MQLSRQSLESLHLAAAASKFAVVPTLRTEGQLSAHVPRTNESAQAVMTPCLFSPDFFRLKEAEEGVISALDIAADTLEEIAKGSEASQETLGNHCIAFLERVKGVQQTLVALGPNNLTNKPHQCNSYSAQIQASLLQQQVQLAEKQLQSARKQSTANKP